MQNGIHLVSAWVQNDSFPAKLAQKSFCEARDILSKHDDLHMIRCYFNHTKRRRD